MARRPVSPCPSPTPIRAERLQPDSHAVHQLAFDDRDDKLLRMEAALDRARERYGPGIAGAALTVLHSRMTS